MEREKNDIATVKIRVSCAATGSLFPLDILLILDKFLSRTLKKRLTKFL